MDELARLTSELVAIDSVNPSLVAGGAGETEIARFVAAWFERAGLDVDVLEPTPGRPSVVAVARGSGGGRSLLLNAHLDTVGTAGMEAPFSGHVERGRLYGRGALDMKGSLAAIMLAGREAVGLGLRGDVLVAAVADEEAGSVGTEAVLARYRADAAIVAEPTWLELAEILAEAGRDDSDFRADLRVPFARDAYEIALDDPFVELVRRHAGEPNIVGMPFWADSGLIAAAGIPTVLFGPGGEGLHETEEWVELADLERCLALYLAVAGEICG